jgi:acetyltransferase-like isoleucine patch superfamily enzyme
MISPDVKLADDVIIHQPDLVNLYGCTIGNRTKIGAFVEVQRDAAIGSDCKISSHTFICSGVSIGDGVFVGHGVMFINDRYPSAVTANGTLQMDADWEMLRTRIEAGASIGSNATILGGITVGASALVGAGAVVTKDVPDFCIVVGVPARIVGDTRKATDLRAVE